jgi:hypothetical protein
MTVVPLLPTSVTKAAPIQPLLVPSVIAWKALFGDKRNEENLEELKVEAGD